MKTYLAILLLLILLISPTVSIAFQNEPKGFRGIVWGTNIRELSDMELSTDAGSIIFYKRKNDKMKIGDADIEKIIYGFDYGRFFFVQIEFNNLSNLRKIKNTLYQLYGRADYFSESIEDYMWLGSNTYKGKIELTYDKTLERGIVTYYTFLPN